MNRNVLSMLLVISMLVSMLFGTGAISALQSRRKT